MFAEWIKKPTTWLSILGFLYAAFEFYVQYTSVNGFDWKKFVPALLIWAIGWVATGKDPKVPPTPKDGTNG